MPKNNELELYYQPKICSGTGEVKGAEALLRWHHSQRGLIQPHEFIPVSEESGVIIPIGEWVLRRACQPNCQWRAAGMKRFTQPLTQPLRHRHYLATAF